MADPGATSDTLAIARPPPEASWLAASDALLDALLLDMLSLLDALLDAPPVDALLDAALLEALPEALLPELAPPPEPQAAITDAPATLTPTALPRRMNRSREIFSFTTLPSVIVHGPYTMQLYTRADGLRFCHPGVSTLRIHGVVWRQTAERSVW